MDVSHDNGPVDWHAAAGSISFAFVQATQGMYFVDSRFHGNWRAMKNAGVPRGAYHVLDPEKDAVAQARFFLRTVRPSEGDLPPVLDIETLGCLTAPRERPLLLAKAGRWLANVHAATGQPPLVYTSPDFWQQLGDPPSPGKYALWSAHPGIPVPRIPRAWTRWTFWQFTREGRCSGVEGYVDLSRFRGSLDDLTNLGLRGRRAFPKPERPAA